MPSPSFIAWLFQRPLLPSDCCFQWLLIMSSPSILACSMAHQLRSCPSAFEGILSATDIVTHSHSRHAVAFAGAVVSRAIARLVYNYPGHSYAHRCLPFISMRPRGLPEPSTRSRYAVISRPQNRGGTFAIHRRDKSIVATKPPSSISHRSPSLRASRGSTYLSTQAPIPNR